MARLPEPLPIAVIIAAHNHERWIGQAVDSALAQNPRPPAEVIVVDDRSSDGTAAAAEAAGARVIRHERNRGAAAARNTGIRACEQPWVAPLDSDDRWLPHMLRTLWPERREFGFAAGASVTVDSVDRPVAYGGPLSSHPVVLGSPAPLVFPENFVSASGVIIRRETFELAGGYREDQRHAEDFDLWLRMLGLRPAVCVPRVVTLYRRHDGQKSGVRADQREAFDAILARHRQNAWYDESLLERRHAVMAWDDARADWASGRRVRALRSGGWVVLRPRRIEAALRMLRRRRAGRRRASHLGDLADLMTTRAPRARGHEAVEVD